MTESRPSTWRCADWPSRLAATVVLLGLTLWMFRALLQSSAERWTTEPQYSHGFVIPFLAIWLGFSRRHRLPAGEAQSYAPGLGLLFISCICHHAATWFYAEALDALGFLFALNGITLIVWGRRFFSVMWPAVVFTGFMLPLPFQLERTLSGPLQMLGASESAWFIQTLGIPAIAQGNTILMGNIRLGVAEACSGLRMLMVFFAISAAAVALSHRARWEKALILFSAIPIALISNIARIVGTAAAFQYASRETAEFIFHDLSGWLMMPLAMLLLYLELRLLDWVFVEQADASQQLTWHSIKT
ncbi:MAG: exosortase/archaeosortase family protein [Planctomycetota bacterium]